jgi:hypothetical protein
LVEHGDHLFTSDARKVVQEIVQRVSAFQVIDQVLDRHSRSRETGVPPRISGSLRITLLVAITPCGSLVTMHTEGKPVVTLNPVTA